MRLLKSELRLGLALGGVLAFVSLLSAQPSNDNCATPLVAMNGANPFTNVGATPDGPVGYDLVSCPTSWVGTDDTLHSDVWFTYTATCNGAVIIDTCAAPAFDTRLAVHAGTSCPVDLSNLIACNDDGSGCPTFSSRVSFDVSTGDQLLIQVGGWSVTTFGTGTLTIACTAQPANDECATPTALTNGNTIYSTLGATSSGINPGCGGLADPIDTWYLYTATCDGNLSVDACASDFDTLLAIWDATTCPVAGDVPLSCSDDSCGAQSVVTASVTTGQQVYVQVGGFQGALGSGTLIVACLPPMPLNDDCASPTIASNGANPFTNIGATPDGPSGFGAPPCSNWAGGSDTLNNDVWFTYTATCNGVVTIDTCTAPTFDTKLAVFNSTACPLDLSTLITCNDDGSGCPDFSSRVTLPVTVGQVVLIEVGGYTATTFGSANLNIQCTPTLSNDSCATPAIATLGANPVSNVGASPDGPGGFGAPPCTAWVAAGGDTLNNDVWFTYTAGCTGTVSIETCSGPTPFDTKLAVYSSTACPTDLTNLIVCNDDAPGCPAFSSQVVFSAVSGTTYLIEVGGYSASTAGSTTLNIACDPTLDVTGDDVVVRGEAPSVIDSATALAAALASNGITATVVEWGFFSGIPSRVWVCNGTYPDNHPLTQAEGQFLADMVGAGNPVYVESGDLWGFDDATAFDQFDGVDGGVAEDGDNSFIAMIGSDFDDAEFAGLNATYMQDQAGNDYTDQISETLLDAAGPNAGVVWNQSVGGVAGYGTGVYYATDAGFGRVLCQSWEFGGYNGNKNVLAGAYIAALGGGGIAVPLFRRGDANGDGLFNIADAVFTLSALFVPGSMASACADAADSNSDNTVNIADAVFTLSGLFVPGASPPGAPHPGCGVDPDSDPALGCASYPTCP
ncbi:MAG: hypothetical protein ACKVX7_03945 [Planctomycetota bacterium]